MDLMGKVFGRWTVLGFSHCNGRVKYWQCKCACGTLKAVRQESLTSGRSTSCGCYHRELAAEIGNRSRTHGDFGTRLYGIWAAMKRRCLNQHTKFYRDYGGRGITVCDDWMKYTKFNDWATSTGYVEGLSIERIDVNGNYCPENCMWIPRCKQCANRRNSVRIEYNGTQYSLREIADITGLKLRTIKGRYERGCSPDEIFDPILHTNRKDV